MGWLNLRLLPTKNADVNMDTAFMIRRTAERAGMYVEGAESPVGKLLTVSRPTQTTRRAWVLQLADDPAFVWHVALYESSDGAPAVRVHGLAPCAASALAVIWVRHGPPRGCSNA